MAAGINIDIAANVRQFQKGTSDAESALTELSSVLDDVAADTQRAANRSGDALGDGFRDGSRDAEKAVDGLGDKVTSSTRKAEKAVDGLGDKIGDSTKTGVKEAEKSNERLERSFKELADSAKRDTKDLGDPMAISTRKGADEAKEGLGEFKDEANSTAREAAASFDGSAESIGDAFQEVAANAFAGFGPAGAAAGLLAAAGLGVVFSKLQEGGEESDAFKEKVADLGAEFIDAGGKGEASLEYVIDKLKELATTTEDGVVNLEDLQEAVEGAGNGKNFEDIARAVAGAGANVDDLLKKQEKLLEQLEEEAQTSDQTATGVYRDNLKKAQAQQLVVDELVKAKDAADQAKAGEEAYAASGGPALQAKADLISNINDAYDDAAGSADDYVDAESGIFDVQGFIDSMTQREQALRDYQETLATAALTPEAKAFISSQGVDSAATFMAGYKTATPAQQAELNRIWSEAGKTSSGSFSSKVKADLSNAGYNTDVVLNPDMSRITAELQRTRVLNIEARVKNNIASQLPPGQGMGVP
ncbi:hypothetical protein [Frigoribacterium sp. PhB118]|uniref:hypothetical protein n=1 Tax=Frigoribacterium sp. PhB118 TaxID=2485175 RepID=UPI000F4AD9C2|nr:hypothetical protein [Frigoribacterium sp. PhB118]ROS57199.1 hypothetical protein EDF21_0854 [Frigoribacterium sp. PhB118]